MSKIFISYRRDDSAEACEGIYKRLAAHFGVGTVFRDVYSIPYGVDFKHYIESVLQECAVELVVIGQRWLDITDPSGRRRLDDPNDVVRLEVEMGLRRGIPVIPLLVNGAEVPSADRLPPGLEPLHTRNVAFIRSDPGTDVDFGRLIRQIKNMIPSRPQPPGWERVLTSHLVELGFDYRPRDGIDVVVPPVVEVSGGSFQMGGTVNDNEKPMRTVTVREFAIGVYPVTVAEYDCFVRTGHRTPPQSEIGWQSGSWKSQLGRSEHPVVNVSWHDAMEYAAWLAERTGQAWRLPTEEEWEKAAGWDADNGIARVYPWGDKFELNRCNTVESEKRSTTPVGTYQRGASPCGAHDMAGNVWEWTSSKYGAHPDERQTRRGGSYAETGGNARCARRVGDGPNLWGNSLGFRLARGLAS